MAEAVRIILRIALNDLKLSLRDRSVVVWAFVVPVVFTFVFGMAFRVISPAGIKAQLVLDNEDRGFISSALIGQLGKENLRLVSVDTLSGDALRTLVIPEGFTRDVLSRKRTALKLVVDEDADARGSQVVRVAIIRALMRTLGTGVKIELEEMEKGNENIGFDGDTLRGTLFSSVRSRKLSMGKLQAEFDSLLSRRDKVVLRRELAGRGAQVPSGFDNSVPGMLVMFVLMTMAFTGELLIYERITGILKRYGYSASTKVEILVGKLAGRAIFASIQMVFLLLFGKYVFGVAINGSMVALVAVLILFAFSMGAYALALGTILKSKEQVSAIAIISTLALSALGGCWWPIEIVPRPFQIVASAIPTGWILDSLKKIIFFGYGFESILLNMALIAALGILSFWVAARKFRF